MGDNNNDNNEGSEKKVPQPQPLEKFSDEEKKEIIQKMKTFLASEDDEKVMLYASLNKQLL